MAFYLAFKEVWRNRGRFFLFSLVIALITTLVLFIAALSEGLATANKQFLVKLDAQLLVFQKNVDLSANTSRIALTKRNDIARVEGVESVGPIGLSNVAIVFPAGKKDLNVSLIGVEVRKTRRAARIDGQKPADRPGKRCDHRSECGRSNWTASRRPIPDQIDPGIQRGILQPGDRRNNRWKAVSFPAFNFRALQHLGSDPTTGCLWLTIDGNGLKYHRSKNQTRS